MKAVPSHTYTPEGSGSGRLTTKFFNRVPTGCGWRVCAAGKGAPVVEQVSTRDSNVRRGGVWRQDPRELTSHAAAPKASALSTGTTASETAKAPRKRLRPG